MGFRSVRELASSLAEDGANWLSWFVKTSTPAPGAAGLWADMSMGAGQPKYNAYVGAQFTATQLINTDNSAIYPGPEIEAGRSRHLTGLSIATTQASNNVPLTFLLCDYLLFYPLIDGDDDGVQTLENTLSLPRFSDGDGVVAMLVCTTPMTANGTATINYTNCAGQSKTSTFGIRASSVIGTNVVRANTSGVDGANCPFIPVGGCRGIRSMQDIQFSAPVGGLMCLVLLKPITSIVAREVNTVTEKWYPIHHADPPKILPGAFLNFLFLTTKTGGPATVRGFLNFAWR